MIPYQTMMEAVARIFENFFTSKEQCKQIQRNDNLYNNIKSYCAFHKYANSKAQKPPSQLHFLLPLIVITITSNKPSYTETHKTDRNPPITNQKPRPLNQLKLCFLRGPLR